MPFLPHTAGQTLVAFVSAMLVALPFSVRAATSQGVHIESVRLGFDGAYKLGCWTQLEVTIAGGDKRVRVSVEASTPDPDGVPAIVTTPANESVSATPGEDATVRLYIRCGQDGAPLRVRLLDDVGVELDARTFFPGSDSTANAMPAGLPATTKLAVAFGTRDGVAYALRGEGRDAGVADVRAIRLDRASDLPNEWYGYEALDAVVLGSSQPEAYRDLAPNSPRIAALTRWVELGGQVVIFCGANAAAVIGPNAPLAGLVPGKLSDQPMQLRQFRDLESFVGAVIRLSRKEKALTFPCFKKSKAASRLTWRRRPATYRWLCGPGAVWAR
jgi:hypothetical protein